MALSDMKVFNEYVKASTIETIAQMVDKFNAASRGSIVLTADGFDGDFLQESMFAGLHSAQRRVDRYAAQATVTPTALTQLQHNSVKVAGGFGPILWEPSQLTWIEKNPAEAIEVISRNLSEAIVQDELNSAIAALVAAIGGGTTNTTNDVSATAGVTYDAINTAHALFGDHSGSLVVQVMNGQMYHKLIGHNIANAATLFQASNITVVDILGKAVVVTDAPALYVTGTPNKMNVLSLVTGAAIVHDGSDLLTNINQSNGKTRIETTFQADYTFGLGLKGYAWDTASGGKSPLDAEIATAANWDKVATSWKHTAGVLTVGDASK